MLYGSNYIFITIMVSQYLMLILCIVVSALRHSDTMLCWHEAI